MVSKHILVFGHVQGVGFRKYVQKAAQDLGAAGWTRNLMTGEVEILIQMDDASITSFLERVKKGPMLAKVDRLEVFEVDSKKIQGHTFLIIQDGERPCDF